MPVHLLEHTHYAVKGVSVAADLVLIADSAATNAPKQVPISGFGGIPAANIVNTSAGNLGAVDVQAALNELQSDIDALITSNAADNFIATAANPVAGDGVAGDFHINVVSGAITGPKVGAVWPAVGGQGNAYSGLGLSAVAGAALTVAGTVGTATVAARGDHSHPFQTAAQTTFTPTGSIASTSSQAAMAELDGDVTALAANTVGTAADSGLGGGAAISTNPNLIVDITGTTALGATPAVTDELLLWDTSGSVRRKVTVAQLVAAATAANLQAVTDVGNVTTNDLEVTAPAAGLVLTDGAQRWRVTVNAVGALVTTAI